MSEEKDEIIKHLTSQLERTSQERDTALEMWSLMEKESLRAKDEAKFSHSSSFVEQMRHQVEDMRCDYSDAINLLESKLQAKTDELESYREANDALSRENEILKAQGSSRENESKDLFQNLDKVKSERDQLQKALEHCHLRIEEIRNIETQTREKLVEAVATAQEALNSEASASAEKARLENAVTELIREAGARVSSEVGAVKKELNAEIKSLSEKLKIVTLERDRLTLEYQSKKSEWHSHSHQMKLSNDYLVRQIKEQKDKRQNELSQFLSERDLLRRQIMTLQAAVEYLPAMSRSQDESTSICQKCLGLQLYVQRYRSLAEKLRKTAFKLSEEFESAMKEERKQWRAQFAKLLQQKCANT